MKIDIDKLTEAELIDLNNRIVARLRFLNQTRAHEKMLEFKVGDRVEFQPDGRPVMVGMLTRYNKKTVTVVTTTTVNIGTLLPVSCASQIMRRRWSMVTATSCR